MSKYYKTIISIVEKSPIDLFPKIFIHIFTLDTFFQQRCLNRILVDSRAKLDPSLTRRQLRSADVVATCAIVTNS